MSSEGWEGYFPDGGFPREFRGGLPREVPFALHIVEGVRCIGRLEGWGHMSTVCSKFIRALAFPLKWIRVRCDFGIAEMSMKDLLTLRRWKVQIAVDK